MWYLKKRQWRKKLALLWCRQEQRTLKRPEPLPERMLLLLEHPPSSDFHWDPTLMWFSPVRCIGRDPKQSGHGKRRASNIVPMVSHSSPNTESVCIYQRILSRSEVWGRQRQGQWLCAHFSGQVVYDHSKSSTCCLWKCGPSVNSSVPQFPYL